jgi:hypothetical protein
MPWAAHTFAVMNSASTTEAGIFSRIIQPESGGWGVEAAQAILQMTFADEDRERMRALLEKAKADELADTERSELLNFQKAGRMLELMKARARVSLQQAAA